MKKSIVLIGFMGVGKTRVGRILAKQLNRNFIDIDSKIEQFFKMPATEIFRVFGERAFREKEKELISLYSIQPNNVISVGGGAFLQDANRRVCLDYTVVIFLDISWETWKNRLNFLVKSRPLLQNKSFSQIKILFDERQSIYTEHHVKISTDSMTVNEIAENIRKNSLLLNRD